MAVAHDSLPQLGRDVFARHGAVPPFRLAPVERTADLSALLRACARLLGSPPPSAAAEVYRPAPPWHATLWCFLPVAEELERRAATRSDLVLNRTLMGRSAAANTFMASLEIAHQGKLVLALDEAFGFTRVRFVRGGDGATAACVQRR